MIHRAILTGLAASAALSLATAAIAQSDAQATAQAEAPDPDQTITVEAPRSVKRPAAGDSHEQGEFLSTTVKIGVLYSDLDLTKDSDADRLMTRVERVANDACSELDRVYPLDPDPECVPRAVGYARKAARAVIDAARGIKPDAGE